jgi:hypothetical protein
MRVFNILVAALAAVVLLANGANAGERYGK